MSILVPEQVLEAAQDVFRNNIRFDPYEHQIEAVGLGMMRLKEYGYYGLLHDMGCGKTVSTIALISRLWERQGLERVLIVAPKSVVPVWSKEFTDAAKFPNQVLELKGSVEKRAEQVRSRILTQDFGGNKGPLVVVVNYESAWRMEGILKTFAPQLIVCDESQRIKTPGSKQSKAMVRLGKQASWRIILSGTPIPEGPLGWYSQFKFLAPKVFGSSFLNFKARYAVEIPMGQYNRVVDYKNLDELEDRVMEVCHRVTKEQAVDLPDEVDIVRSFTLSKKARRVYDDLVKHSIALLQEDLDDSPEIVADHVLTKMMRLQQLTGGFLTDEDGVTNRIHTDKLKLLRDVLEDLIDSGEQVVVFHRFTAEGLAIRSLLKSMKVECSYIDGSCSVSARGGAVESFQSGKSRVFVGQIQAAGTGITLTAASTSIFYSQGFSSEHFEQAKARIHRIGQTNRVNHIYLQAEDTIDEQVIEALRQKRNVSEEMVDGGWRRYVTGGYDSSRQV